MGSNIKLNDYIGREAFANCASLPSVTLGAATTIDYEAFHRCDSLTSVTLGTSVTNIGDYAFRDCARLTRVTFNGAYPNVTLPSRLYWDTPSVTSYVTPAHAASWMPHLDSGNLADGTAVWCGRPLRLAE